ncbi:hypothetical protein GCM10009818_02980 [Nakamurella flavida]
MLSAGSRTSPGPDTAPTDAAGAATTSVVVGGLARGMAAAGLALVAVTLLAVGYLHLAGPTAGISWARRTISEYALTDSAWLFNLGVVALAAGSVCILAALVTQRLARPGSAGVLLGLVWSAALLALVVFPKHNWAVGPSTDGQIHRVASLVAFLALPVAVMLLTRRGRGGRRVHRPGWARAGFWLGVASLVWFSPLAGSFLLAPVTGVPWYRAIPLGTVERGLALTEVLAVLAVGLWAMRVARVGVPGHTRPVPPPPAGADR